MNKKCLYWFIIIGLYFVGTIEAKVVSLLKFDTKEKQKIFNGINGRPSELIGAGLEIVKGKFGNAISFGDLHGYVEIDSFGLLPEWSIAFWVKSENNIYHGLSVWEGQAIYSTRMSDPDLFQGCHINIEKGVPNVLVVAISNQKYKEDEFYYDEINLDEWTHFVVTYNCFVNESKLYINGKMVRIKKETLGPIYFDVATLGSLNGNQRYFNGMLDEFVFYDHVLSAKEVNSLFRHSEIEYINPKVFYGNSSDILEMSMSKELKEVFYIIKSSEELIIQGKGNEAANLIIDYLDRNNGPSKCIPPKKYISDATFQLLKAEILMGKYPHKEIINLHQKYLLASDSALWTKAEALSNIYSVADDNDYLEIIIKYYSQDYKQCLDVINEVVSNMIQRKNYAEALSFLDKNMLALSSHSKDNMPLYNKIIESFEKSTIRRIFKSMFEQNNDCGNVKLVIKYLEELDKANLKVVIEELIKYYAKNDCFLSYVKKDIVGHSLLLEIFCQLISNKNYSDAKDLLESIGDDRNFYDKLIYKPEYVEYLFDQGEYDKVNIVVNRNIVLNNNVSRTQMSSMLKMHADSFLQNQNADYALKVYSKLLMEYPELSNTNETKYMLGYCYMLQGNIERAMDLFKLLINEDLEDAYSKKAKMYISQFGG